MIFPGKSTEMCLTTLHAHRWLFYPQTLTQRQNIDKTHLHTLSDGNSRARCATKKKKKQLCLFWCVTAHSADRQQQTSAVWVTLQRWPGHKLPLLCLDTVEQEALGRLLCLYTEVMSTWTTPDSYWAYTTNRDTTGTVAFTSHPGFCQALQMLTQKCLHFHHFLSKDEKIFHRNLRKNRSLGRCEWWVWI